MTKKKAWSGRFKGELAPEVEKFNASINFDRRLYRHDIALSIAHAAMLGRERIIPASQAVVITRSLKKIEKEISSGKLRFKASDEDIHMAIERRLSMIAGPDIGGKLHTARSRNDQVATSFRMYVRDEIDSIRLLLRKLQRALFKRATGAVEILAPAYTHLQPAQPVRFAHWFLAYFEMFDRDSARFADARKRVNVMPLGSAALAGTNFPIDRQSVAKELGFDSISQNSMDAVSDRDFAVEFLFAVSMTATHLSRLAEEIIIMSSAEFGVVELPDSFCTGSSIMPQKKNPDVPELIRGKTGRINGNLVALLTMLKGLPLAYNKDMQEDKEPVFDSSDQIKSMLDISSGLVLKMKLNVKKLGERAGESFMTAVDIADRMAMAGTPFREAHQIVGRLTRHCLDNNIKFIDLKPAQIKKIDPRLVKAIKGGITASVSADGKNVIGGSAKKRILARLKQIEKMILKWEK
ncbi:Argininosuccinate lyase [hydrothermal vent metagenome]|uniref:Argininosuccinate lyase n=1 Tax=hydrothermal vent metagenome TaxID=652676 RepID=A0A3B1C3U4_9ZZZZ